jgi:glycosyltransferase involved in cell wall biosynthesis
MKNRYLSIVVPLFNEESNVVKLLQEIKIVLEPLNLSYELVAVDDGSSDSTWDVLCLNKMEFPFLKPVKLARNFGHQNALLAGLSVSNGDVIITMDGDLQHPPTLVVNTIRNDQNVSSWFKRTSSAFFYKTFSFLTDVKMYKGQSDFRLMDRKVVEQLLSLNDVELFIRGSVEWLGFKSSALSYEANARYSGRSKYDLRKMISFARGSIVSFSTKPLIIGIRIGVITSLLSFLEIGYVIFQWLNGETIAGWASSIALMSFLFGVLFILLGVIGLYLSHIHIALKNRPSYIIEKIDVENEHG